MGEKPIKVLAVVCQMNRGGLESRLMDIIRHIDYGQVQIDVFTYRKEPGIFDEEIKELGGKIYYNPPLTIKNMFWYVGYFSNFLKQHTEYRIIHAHQDAWCSVFCKGAKEAGVPVRIAHSRTAIQNLRLSDIAKNIIKLPTRKYATEYFAVSDKAAEWLFGKKAVDSGKVLIWPNAIKNSEYVFNLQIRQKMREKLEIKNQKVLIHVGNFTAPKNHEFLIDIFERVCEKEPNTVLILIGGGESQNIKRRVEEKHLRDKVMFLGSRNDVKDLLQVGDVMVFPSKFEGLPGAVLEAQAAGLPCLLSDAITKNVEITPYVKWLSLKENSALEWAEKAIEMMEMDRIDTSEFFRKSGFDISILVERLSNFYKQKIEN
ncbi:MAG: glycosyltransferase [Acetivibrio ethanolgignens]